MTHDSNESTNIVTYTLGPLRIQNRGSVLVSCLQEVVGDGFM